MISLTSDTSIFVYIPAYRDPEIFPTLQDLYAQAKHPDQIYVGVCWQYGALQGESPLIAPIRFEQVRVINYLAAQSEGVGWARQEAQKLYKNEVFVLQIDCHMRFIKHWDEFLLEQWQQCEDEQAVLSCHPAAYEQSTGQLKSAIANIRNPKQFKENGLLELQTTFLKEAPVRPNNVAFVSPKFIFAPAQLLAEVPADPEIYFKEEEISLSIRLWSHGWNIYSPVKPPLYHSFNTTGKKRPLHWKDHSNWSALQQRATSRCLALWAGEDYQKPFGLGQVRSPQAFHEFCGVNDIQKNLDKSSYQGNKPGIGLSAQTVTPKAAAVFESETSQASSRLPNDHENGQFLQPGLNVGDFIPFFRLPDQNSNLREMQSYGGLQTVLFFFPIEDGQLSVYLKALESGWERLRGHNLQTVVIVSKPPEALQQLQQLYSLSFSLWSDQNHTVSQTIGIYDSQCEDVEACCYTLSPNLRIQKKYALGDLDTVISQVIADMQPPEPQPGPVVTMHAPVLIVPDVLTPRQCQFLIDHWHQGNQFEGKVGGGTQSTYRKTAKVRTDILLKPDLMKEFDYIFGGTLFPEIEKVFGLKVAYREDYKIGCYDAAKGGFFKAHRDNFHLNLSHRRVAMTLNLNNDYGGGGLNFPEYGNFVYKPPAGGAVVFPCSLMHQALPVTSGRRFMMVSFFFGEYEINYRLTFVPEAEKHYPASQRRLLASSKIWIQGQDNVRARYSFET